MAATRKTRSASPKRTRQGTPKASGKRGKTTLRKQPAVPQTPAAPTIVKVHAAKTHLSKLLQQVARGDRVLIANGNQAPGFELVAVRPVPVQGMPRRFGALRGVVTVNTRFFEPLPAAELTAWEG